MSSTDAVFSPRERKKHYQTHLSPNHKITSLSSVCGATETVQTVITAKPVYSSKPIHLSEKKATHASHLTSWETPYPKILQDGAVENFRPQEVSEKVTHAEPLSPPNEQEGLAIKPSGDKEDEENCKNVNVETPEENPVVQSCYQVESDSSHHLFTTSNLTPEVVRITEKPCFLSDESDKHVYFKGPAEKTDLQEQLHAPIDAWVKNDSVTELVQDVQEEISGSETEAVPEPSFVCRTSSPASECEPEDSVINQPADFSQNENIPTGDTVEERQEISSSPVGTSETGVDEKLYPDGEEMDTWDSVIERKAEVETDDGKSKDEGKRQHAEPEEDISAIDPVNEKREVSLDYATDVQENIVASAAMDTQEDDEVQRVMLEQENVLLSDKEDDEEEDSQNVSVSWKTEVESDSYAQENTLADTRPLIQYKSDETDATASHMEESESSEAEQEKKFGETGTWSEGKSKRFGTMEDLCEEAEGEALDEEYDLGYTHTEDRDVGHSLTTSECAESGKDIEKEEELMMKVDDEHSDEETEEPSKLMVNADFDEELDTDRLVEQELENLCTDSYSAHFAQQQDRKSEEISHLQDPSVEVSDQEEAGQTETEAAFLCEEPPQRENYQPSSSTAIKDHQRDNLYFNNSSVTQTETLVDDEIQHEKQKATDAEKREEDDEHNVSMVTHADEVDNGFNDVMTKPDVEEISNSEDPNSVQEVATPMELNEVVPVDVSNKPQEHLAEEVADCHSLHDAAEAVEWEVLEDPCEDLEMRDETEHGQICDNVPHSDESYHHDEKEEEKGSVEGIMIHQEESHEVSPDSVPEEKEIFVEKDSTDLLDKSGEDNSLHDVFSSGIKNDFWVSSVETGATYQPDDAFNEVAEQTNQNTGFGHSLVWGTLENTNAVNGNSRVDTESSKDLEPEEEQGQMESVVKQVLSRNVEGELVHSEESEVEGESWSSGEETV